MLDLASPLSLSVSLHAVAASRTALSAASLLLCLLETSPPLRAAERPFSNCSARKGRC